MGGSGSVQGLPFYILRCRLPRMYGNGWYMGRQSYGEIIIPAVTVASQARQRYGGHATGATIFW